MNFPKYKKLLSIITAVTLTSAPVLSPLSVMAQEEDIFSAETAESEIPSVTSDTSSELTDEDTSAEPDENISEEENSSDDLISSEPEETANDPVISEEEISVDNQDPDSSSNLELTEETGLALNDSEEILMDENTQENLEDLFDSNAASVATGSETKYTLGTTLTVDTEDTVSYYFVAAKTGFYKIDREVLNYDYDDDGDIDGSYGSSLSSAIFLKQGEVYHFTINFNTFDDFYEDDADVYNFTISFYKDLSNVSDIVDAGLVLSNDCYWILDNSQTLTVFGSTPEWFDNDSWNNQLDTINQHKDSIKAITFTNGSEIIDSSFSNLPKLQSINLPSTLTKIHASFDNCPSLKSVTFPDSLQELSGFDNCSGLKSVTFPNSLDILGGFYNCSSLESVTFPNSLSSIAGAFDNCSSLKSVTLPNSLIYLNGFNNCNSLESVSLPASLIQLTGFNKCPKLNKVTLPANSNLKYITSVTYDKHSDFSFAESLWYNAQKYFVKLSNIIFKYRGKETSVTVPDNVRLVQTFLYNTTVKNVTIPGSVTNVSYATFAGATSLEKIVLKNGVKTIDENAFLSCKKLKEITIPKSVTKLDSSSIGYYYDNNHRSFFKFTKNSLPTINCYSNSAAHKYAVKNGIPYKLLDVLTVKFNGFGAKPSKASIKVTCKKAYGTLPTVKRTGYTFLGWYTAPKGGSKITAKSLVTATKNHTLYARWKGNKVTVKFNGNGGKVSKASLVKEFGKTYSTLPSVRRNGYIFQGWYTAKTKGTKVTSKSYIKNYKTHTLYARWKKK